MRYTNGAMHSHKGIQPASTTDRAGEGDAKLILTWHMALSLLPHICNSPYAGNTKHDGAYMRWEVQGWEKSRAYPYRTSFSDRGNGK